MKTARCYILLFGLVFLNWEFILYCLLWKEKPTLEFRVDKQSLNSNLGKREFEFVEIYVEPSIPGSQTNIYLWKLHYFFLLWICFRLGGHYLARNHERNYYCGRWWVTTARVSSYRPSCQWWRWEHCFIRQQSNFYRTYQGMYCCLCYQSMLLGYFTIIVSYKLCSSGIFLRVPWWRDLL